MLRTTVVLCVALSFVPAALSGQSRLYGDCALPPDGSINVLDGLQAARYSVGLDPEPSPASPDYLACDVNDDGALNVLDGFSISNYSVGSAVSDPVGLPIPNAPPTAVAGGPYTALVGDLIPLDGSGSVDDHPPLQSYDWDLDANGSFESAGAMASFACVSVGTFAVFLALECRALLLGESADARVRRDIEDVVRRSGAVDKVHRLLTMQMAPDQVLVNLDARFRPDLGSAELARAIDELEETLRAAHGSVRQVFVEPAGDAGSQRAEETAERRGLPG